MPRQERYSYSPQTQAQLIDYSPVDYSAGDALALQYLGERNKAYNEAEAMPTAFSSAVGDMRFSNNDRATIDKHMQRINEDINKEVNEKYNGDYALAKSAIAKKLMSSKNIFNIAQQNYELEAKARDKVNELIAMGKGPTEFVQDDKGNMVRRNITPDELFAGKSVFDSQGNIKGLPNYEIYSAGEHDKWVEDAYSKALNAATSPETISKDPKAVGYLRVAKARGMSDEDVQNYMFGKDGNLNPTGQSIVDTFLKDSPQAAREFAKIKDPNLIGKYVANIIKGQTSKVSDSQFINDRAFDFEQSQQKSSQTSSGVPFVGVDYVGDEGSVEDVSNKMINIKDYLAKSGGDETYLTKNNPFLKENLSKSLNPNLSPVDRQIAGEVYSRMNFELGQKQGVQSKEFNKLKSDYSLIYDKAKKSGLSDAQFVDYIGNLETANAKMKYRLNTHPDASVQSIFAKGINSEVQLNPDTKVMKLNEKFGDDEEVKVSSISKGKGLDDNSSAVDLYHGRIIIKGNDGSMYKVPVTALREDVKANLAIAQRVMEKYSKYNQESMKPEIISHREVIPGTSIMAYPVIVTEFNPETSEKTIKKYYVENPRKGITKDNLYSDSDGRQIGKSYKSLNEFSNEYLNKIYNSYNPYSKGEK